MTHLAMSSIRVMATCALLGEAVGKAAFLASSNGISPHDVYLEHLADLQRLLMNEDCFLPSKMREISAVCQNASLTPAAEFLRNGQDRTHVRYGTEDEGIIPKVPQGQEIVYTFAPATVKSVHAVFSSDLNRDTLPGGKCERTHSTRANRTLNSPQMHMPTTLCKEFSIWGEYEGKKIPLLEVKENRKRAYHLPVGQVMDKLILRPLSTWGDFEEIPVLSFDFDAE